MYLELGSKGAQGMGQGSLGVLVTGSQIYLNYEKLCPLSDKTL